MHPFAFVFPGQGSQSVGMLDGWGDHPAVRRTLDGSVVVFYGDLRGGLPITLESEPDAGWLTRAQVESIALRASSPGGVYPLVLRGQTWTVMFRHQDAPAFEAKPLVTLANPQAGDFYLATLKLMTV